MTPACTPTAVKRHQHRPFTADAEPALSADFNNWIDIMPRIAIHGFGRIGRSLMKVALKDGLFVPVSISDIKDLGTLAALFEVDSNYGRWHEAVATKDSSFVIG